MFLNFQLHFKSYITKTKGYQTWESATLDAALTTALNSVINAIELVNSVRSVYYLME